MSAVIYIHDEALTIPEPCEAGALCTQREALLLNYLWLKRFTSLMRKWLEGEPNASPEAIAAKAAELSKAISFTDIEVTLDDNPVLDEARALARDEILRRLAAENLPPPQGLELHINAMLDADKSFMAKAQQRLEIRRAVASEALRNIER